MRLVLSKLRAFKRDERGSLAMILAVSLVPIMLIIGLTIDYGRGYQLKTVSANATDAAMIALARLPPNLTDDARRQIAFDTFKANMRAGSIQPDNVTLAAGGNLPFDVDVGRAVLAVDLSDINNVKLSSISAIKNSFMPMADFSGKGKFDKLVVRNHGALEKDVSNLELSIALDLSGSMNWSAGNGGGTRIAAARKAIEAFGNVLLSDEAQNSQATTLIGVVPWTFNVQIPALHVMGTKVLTSKMNTRYKRRGIYPLPYACTLSPVAKTPKYWERYYYKNRRWNYQRWWRLKDKPGDVRGVRSYSPSKNGRPVHVLHGNAIDDDGGQARYRACPKYLPLDLMSNRDTLNSYVDLLRPGGGTDTNSGLYWADQMLDRDNPVWTSPRRAAYSDPDTNKVIVLMTDGANFRLGLNKGFSTYKYSPWNKMVKYKSEEDETYGEFPLPEAAMDVITQADLMMNQQYSESMNGRFLSQCAAIRSKGVIIYTIGFGLTNNSEGERHARKMLEFCAGASGNREGQYAYEAATAEDLENVFVRIAAGVNGVRLTH